MCWKLKGFDGTFSLVPIAQCTYAAAHSELESIHKKWKVALGVNREHTMDRRQQSALKQLSSSVSHFLKKVSPSSSSEEIVSVSWVHRDYNSPTLPVAMLWWDGRNMNSECRDALFGSWVFCCILLMNNASVGSAILIIAKGPDKAIEHGYAQLGPRMHALVNIFHSTPTTIWYALGVHLWVLLCILSPLSLTRMPLNWTILCVLSMKASCECRGEGIFDLLSEDPTLPR